MCLGISLQCLLAGGDTSQAANALPTVDEQSSLTIRFARRNFGVPPFAEIEDDD